MNEGQKKVLVASLYIGAALLVFVFWRVGTQYDYGRSILLWEFHRTSEEGIYGLGEGIYGVRLRMGALGVICGLIVPVMLAAAGTFIQKADR